MNTQSKKKHSVTASQFSAAFQALARYEKRQARLEHPEGSFDRAARWYPSGRDSQVISFVREPSRSFPNSYNLSCRSLAHCERYEDADHDIVLLMRRALKKNDMTASDDGAREYLQDLLA